MFFEVVNNNPVVALLLGFTTCCIGFGSIMLGYYLYNKEQVKEDIFELKEAHQ